MLLIILTTLFKDLTYEGIIWPCILFVALLEPVFQTALGFSRPVSPWATGFVALHIFLLNLCQLAIFKRYDFVSMYAFRLMYYLERSCRLQLEVMQTGRAVHLPPEAVCEHTARQWETGAAAIMVDGVPREWPALKRMLCETDPSFMQ